MSKPIKKIWKSDLKEKKDKPNIVFFLTDDQRFDTIKALGNKQIFTPNLDYFVRTGTSFTQASIMGGTCLAVCMPSRAMLMTGKTLFHLRDHGERIPNEHIMLPELLQQHGYSTFGTGKWHNGTSSYARCFTHGGEIFFGGMDDHWNVPVTDFDPSSKYDSARPYRLDVGPYIWITEQIYDHIHRGKHSSELFCDAAIHFLRDYNFKKPFFMYVSFMAPHDPRTMPQQYLNMYDPEQILLPKNFMPQHPFDNGELRGRDELLEDFPRRPDRIRRHIAEYYAMISHIDAEIGRVLDMLKATKQLDNTIIIFSGDNGLALGQHGLMGKQSNYEHSIRVPLIMSGPGIPEGQKREAFCYLHDIYPTLCELVGIPIPETVEGTSLIPAMQNPEEKTRDTLFFAYKDCQRTVKDHRYKLIEYVVDHRRTTQLFDLVLDPFEIRNLSNESRYTNHRERLRGKLLCWRNELDDSSGEF